MTFFDPDKYWSLHYLTIRFIPPYPVILYEQFFHFMKVHEGFSRKYRNVVATHVQDLQKTNKEYLPQGDKQFTGFGVWGYDLVTLSRHVNQALAAVIREVL